MESKINYAKAKHGKHVETVGETHLRERERENLQALGSRAEVVFPRACIPWQFFSRQINYVVFGVAVLIMALRHQSKKHSTISCVAAEGTLSSNPKCIHIYNITEGHS